MNRITKDTASHANPSRKGGVKSADGLFFRSGNPFQKVQVATATVQVAPGNDKRNLGDFVGVLPKRQVVSAKGFMDAVGAAQQMFPNRVGGCSIKTVDTKPRFIAEEESRKIAAALAGEAF